MRVGLTESPPGGAGSDHVLINDSDAIDPSGAMDTYFLGAESDTFEVRGATKVVAGNTVLDQTKVDAITLYVQNLVALGKADYDDTIDNLLFTLLPEGPT